MASFCGHVQTRADESGRERASVRGGERVVYTELIVLVFSLELDELEEGRALWILMCFKLLIKLIKLVKKFVNY